MQSGRPAKAPAAAAAKKEKEEEEHEPTAAPVVAVSAPAFAFDRPVAPAGIYSPHVNKTSFLSRNATNKAMADSDDTTMTREQLVAANADYYNKLTERDDKIAELEAELRAKLTKLDDATNNNTNLQKEVKQYAKEVKDKQQELNISEATCTSLRNGNHTRIQELEKKEKATNQCFHDAQAVADEAKRDLRRQQEWTATVKETLDGVTKENMLYVQQLRWYQSREKAFQDAGEFADSISREFELVFQEMGRDMNPATILSHIHELQAAASKPRRKSDRKVSIADELAGHSDAESVAESLDGSEHGDDDLPIVASQPAIDKPQAYPTDVLPEGMEMLPEITEEEIHEAEEQDEADTATEGLLAALDIADSTTRRAKVAEVMSHYQEDSNPAPSKSPVPEFDYEKELSEALQRYKQAEAALADMTTRVERMEAIERVRLTNANEADRVAAINKTTDDAAVEKRTAEQDTITAAEKLRLTNEIARLNALVDFLRDRIADGPNLKAHNYALLEKAKETHGEQRAELQRKDADHERRQKAKDVQVAEWQQAINEAQSNSLLIGPLEFNPVYIDAPREKTTLEWLHDQPFWWQFLLAMMFLFLVVGNLSAWMERQAWVDSNIFAMDHIRAMAKQGISGPSAITLWFEDLIGFDRTYLG